jgi:hypothetical protein
MSIVGTTPIDNEHPLSRPSLAWLRVERLNSICMVKSCSSGPAAPLTHQAFQEVITGRIFRGGGQGTNDISECFV